MFHREHPFVPLDVTEADMVFDNIAFGWFWGFGFFVFLDAISETRRASRKFSAYIIMIWLEIAANISFAIISWGYLNKHFPPGLPVFAGVIACWITQVQCLMLIIANRTCLLYSNRRPRLILKCATAGIVTIISICTACIWIPAHLQISHYYIALNHWYDKFEKTIYLLLDASLNYIFIRTVKKRLVDHGLTKYDKVVKFNQYIIFVSIAMDLFLLGMTMLRNEFVYCQFHPITYIVKLEIEISMSQLIISVARSTGVTVYEGDRTRSYDVSSRHATTYRATTVHVSTQVHTHCDEDEDNDGNSPSSGDTTKDIVDICRRTDDPKDVVEIKLDNVV